MKKFFSFIILFLTILLCSCSTTTMCVGSVTTYNSDGTILREWDNVILEETTINSKQSSIKQYGLNFYDKSTNKNIIISNSVPMIIEYIVTKNSGSYTNVSGSNIPYNLTKEQKESYKNEYKELKEELKENKLAIKYAVKNNLDCKNLKDRKAIISKRIKELETIFFYRNITIR